MRACTAEAALLAVLSLAACADVEAHLAAGRVVDACERAMAHPDDEGPVFQAWVSHKARVTATAAPHEEVEGALGGRVAGYGTDIAVYSLSGAVPGGTVSLEVPSSLGVADLVMRLSPLVHLERPPRLAAVLDSELVPTPHAQGQHQGRDGLTEIIEAVGAAGTGIGMALGMAVAAPIGLMVGVAKGFASVVDALLGGARAAAPPMHERVAPILIEAPVDQSSRDALLAPGELAAAQTAVDQEHLRHTHEVAAEQAHRVALANNATLLGIDATACTRTGMCRVVLETPPPSVVLLATFGARCSVRRAAVRLDVVPLSARLAFRPTNELIAPFATAGVAPLTVSLDTGAPAFALEYPMALARAQQAATSGAVERIEDLLCVVHVKRARFDEDGTAPDLVVRINAGRARSRLHTAFIGKNLVDASFLTQGIGIVPGERVRLSLVSRSGRSLGGIVVEFDGRTPLLFDNSAFRATCAPYVVEAAARAGARDDAATAIEELRTAAGGDLVVLARERSEARAAIVRFAALAGWDEARVLVAQLHHADPLMAP